MACVGGCIGGPLTVMNRFAAVAKLREHVHDFYLEKQLFPQLIVREEDIIPQVWELPLPENHAMRLSENIGEAMTKYEQIDEILATLPQPLECFKECTASVEYAGHDEYAHRYPEYADT